MLEKRCETRKFLEKLYIQGFVFRVSADEKLIVSKDQLDNKNYFKLSHGKKKHILLKFTN